MRHQAWVLLVSYVLLLTTSSIAQAATPGSSQAIRNQGLLRHARPDNTLHAASLLTLRDSNASLLLVARQQLFDYATTEGLDLLQHIISQLAVPTYSKKIHVPVLGEIDIEVRNITVKKLLIPAGAAHTSIQQDEYRFQADPVDLSLDFEWHWSKSVLSGTGAGVLKLKGGLVDVMFTVAAPPDAPPQVQITSASTLFDAIDLAVHAYDVDWLYQALLALFHGAIKGQIELLINDAVSDDLPDAVNSVLATLPTNIEIDTLPFHAIFTYAIYTSNLVMVKGYASYDDAAAPVARAARRVAPTPPAPLSPAATPVCPYHSTPPPLDPATLLPDPHMGTFLLHSSVANCILYGLYTQGALHASVQDGDLPGIRLFTDLFITLMPQLPHLYPHKRLALNITATAPPTVAFTPANLTAVTANYTTTIIVLDATPTTPALPVATLATNLTFHADLQWDSTKVSYVDVHYAVASSDMPVSVLQWDLLLRWVLTTQASRTNIHQLVDQFVSADVASQVKLSTTSAAVFDEWYAMSADVQLDIGVKEALLRGLTRAAEGRAARAGAGGKGAGRRQAGRGKGRKGQ